MPDYNIKISELDAFTAPRSTEDFLPLVDSSSMTTYRATIQDIGSLMTHSIYADTASISLYNPTAVSASHARKADDAISASYALSSSHARLADSASYYPPPTVQVSASWASRSLQAYYSTRSLDVDTSGRILNFPYWNTADGTAGTNGALQKYSPLSAIPSWLSSSWTWTNAGPLIIDSGSTLVIAPYSMSYVPYYWFDVEPKYTLTRYNGQANMVYENFGPGGLQTFWPITSHTFIGNDQRFWNFYTASNALWPWATNQYFSGSAGGPDSGSWQTIPNMAGGLSQSFNGKWMRIISTDNWWTASHPSYGGCSQHPGYGSMTQTYGNLGGLIKLQMNTPVGTDPIGGNKSNAQSTIWAHIFCGMWGSPPQITILSSNYYSAQLIKALRLGIGNQRDPIFYLDVLLDNMTAGDEYFRFEAQSFNGGIRFLSIPNFGPWPAVDTGSNDIHQDARQLIVPNAPGHYSAIDPIHKRMNYYLQGKNVVINPTINEITESGLAYSPNASTMSLHVSGGINASKGFYCANNAGLTTKVTYGTTNLYFSGGILIQKEPPDGAVVPPVGTPCNGTSTYTGGNAMPNEQTWNLGSGTGIVTVHFFSYGYPDRLQVYFDGNVILNTGYRGNASYQTDLNNDLASYGSASEYIAGSRVLTASFFKNSATTTAKVQVFGPGSGTKWDYWISCPGQPIS